MIWSPSLISELKRLWGTGLSASRIAGELTDFAGVPVTKNMVIGKRDRLGLPQRREGSPGRRGDSRPHEYRPPGLEPSKPRTMEPIAPLPSITMEVPVQSADTRVRLVETRDGQCRFIADEPTAEAMCCGRAVARKTSWCAEHLARVEAPPREHSNRRAA